jgi:hypothetical protein
MTTIPFKQALRTGFERMAAWSDLLDDINVFPVADGDTGRNLQVSLMPLRADHQTTDHGRLTTQLLLAARGNSGNIATQFFSEFGRTTETSMARAAHRGAMAAYRAVGNPREGTMLTVFDTLAAQLADRPEVQNTADVSHLLGFLQAAVRESRQRLPALKAAGVVDAGALGMFLFFEGFFTALINRVADCRSPGHYFPDSLQISTAFRAPEDRGYCVDTVLQSHPDMETVLERLQPAVDSMVALSHGDMIKLHFHTADREAVRRTLAAAGGLLSWSDDDLAQQVRSFRRRAPQTRVHVVTDGAASLTRADQAQYGFTILDSYIAGSGWSRPETHLRAMDLYRRMRSGERIATAQASLFERHQNYQRLLETYPEVLYLCVGSAFTGNYATAKAWQVDHDPQNHFRIIDTGAASGRLAVMVLAAARLAQRGGSPRAVAALAQTSLTICREYIFIDRLKYLAAGGRLSRPGALAGDLLQVKPVISPLPTGAQKIGRVKNRRQQVQFALDRLHKDLAGATTPLILLEYSDNREWVAAEVHGRLQTQFPSAEIILQPLSLTTGAHTGPGTWAVAVHPDPAGRLAALSAEGSSKGVGQPRAPSEGTPG